MATGRKPIATAIKVARGPYNKNPQRRNTREPAPKLATPKKPKSLIGDKVAGEFWKTTCGLLEELGVLAITDVHVVEAYCLNESQMVAAYKTIKKDGISTGGRSSAATTHWHKCMDRRLKFMELLGLSPGARSRLHAAPKDEYDPFLEFLALSK